MKFAKMEIRKNGNRGNLEIWALDKNYIWGNWKLGKLQIQKNGNLGKYKFGKIKICKFAKMEIWKNGNSEKQKFGIMKT